MKAARTTGGLFAGARIAAWTAHFAAQNLPNRPSPRFFALTGPIPNIIGPTLAPIAAIFAANVSTIRANVSAFRANVSTFAANVGTFAAKGGTFRAIVGTFAPNVGTFGGNVGTLRANARVQVPHALRSKGWRIIQVPLPSRLRL